MCCFTPVNFRRICINGISVIATDCSHILYIYVYTYVLYSVFIVISVFDIGMYSGSNQSLSVYHFHHKLLGTSIDNVAK